MRDVLWCLYSVRAESERAHRGFKHWSTIQYINCTSKMALTGCWMPVLKAGQPHCVLGFRLWAWGNRTWQSDPQMKAYYIVFFLCINNVKYFLVTVLFTYTLPSIWGYFSLLWYLQVPKQSCCCLCHPNMLCWVDCTAWLERSIKLLNCTVAHFLQNPAKCSLRSSYPSRCLAA